MYLKRFKSFGQYVEFDEISGNASALEKTGGIAAGSVLGICDLVADSWLAVYMRNGALTLQHGKVIVDLDAPDTTVDYAHLDGGTTKFQISQGGRLSLVLNYPSWWTHAQFVAGLGSGPDDESDFCAYLKLMMDSDTTRQHMRSKYSPEQAS